MRVIDHEPSFWYLLEDGPELFLDVYCSRAHSIFTVTIRLTAEEAAQVRAGGRACVSRLAEQVNRWGPDQPRDVSVPLAGRVQPAIQAWQSTAEVLGWLGGTQWYVTTENLLAYLTDPALSRMTPVADQTLWSIDTAAEGSFQGTSQTQLWVRGPGGDFHPMSSATNAMAGAITGDGEITIVFTPDDPSQAQTVGYGHLLQVDGEWRMEMQMATGTQSIVMHWAYMTRWTGDGMPAAPDERTLDPDLRSEEWRWLRGTTWSAVDEELFPDGATFTVGEYRNGYFWGEGTTADGSALRTAGSVTPEGSLYLLFSVADAPAVARRGSIVAEGQAYRMTWSQPSGGATTGGAT